MGVYGSYEYMSVHICMCVHMWSPEQSVQCLLLSLCVAAVRHGLLLNRKLAISARLASQ